MRYNWLGTWLIPVILVLIFILGIYLIYQPLPHIDHEFTKSTGHAFIIASILSLTIDLFMKKRLVREVLQNVDKVLIGYDLPSELQDKIKDIRETRIIRKDWHFHYRIIPIEGQLDKIKVETQISGQLENLSSQPQTYQQYLYFEGHTNPVILELRCDSGDEHARYYFNEQKLQEEPLRSKVIQQKESGLIEVYGEQLILQSHKLSFRYHIGSKYCETFPDQFSSNFVILGSAINILITAEYPEDFVFEGPTSTEHVNRWEYKRAFLNGESLTIRWYRKPVTNLKEPTSPATN